MSMVNSFLPPASLSNELIVDLLKDAGIKNGYGQNKN
jgi:hypothetical protein